MGAGRWFDTKMTKDEIVSAASAHCMKSKKVVQPSVYCPNYKKTIKNSSTVQRQQKTQCTA